MITPRFLMIVLAGLIANAGIQAQSFNLQQMLSQGKLESYTKDMKELNEGNKHGLTFQGLIWLTGQDFSTGTIDLDMRGRDVLQKSFLGVVFHGVDTVTHDIVYFRPFNYRADDPLRKIHAVQYVSQPEFPWDTLRARFPGVYEKGINPPPPATEWFHARIVVGARNIKVYVNGASTPSLTVDKLNNRTSGKIGLWNADYGQDGDFANLKIVSSK
jgi:hypothetical protein